MKKASSQPPVVQHPPAASHQELSRIEGSRLFDAAWYLGEYPDVRETGESPAEHYMKHGWREGRDPGPRFSSKGYLSRYPDLKEAGINPLLHYIEWGEAEGRHPSSYPDLTLFESEDGSNPLVSPDRDRRRNADEAAQHPQDVAASAAALDRHAKTLLALAPPAGAEVPEIFHFVYGFKDSGDIPYFGYMAVKSALHYNPGWQVFFHCVHEPDGPHWARIKDLVTVIRIDDFSYFGNAKFHHYAHKADVVRLLALNLVGGIYLDLDTITQKSYSDLRQFDFCMAVQAAGPDSASGLCNAVMIARPHAVFLENWIAQYDFFRSKGRDDLWDFHSVKLPSLLMARHPSSIHVLDYRAFFFPLWNTLEQTLFSDNGARFDADLRPAYCFHLWNGASGPFLNTIDETFINKSQSIYARIAKEVEGLH